MEMQVLEFLREACADAQRRPGEDSAVFRWFENIDARLVIRAHVGDLALQQLGKGAHGQQGKGE